MIAIIRLFLLALFILFSTPIMLLVCIVRPFNPNNAFLAARLYGQMAFILGIRIKIEGKQNILSKSCCVYIANHQSNYDIFIATVAVPERTVSIGKKSILFFPFFGLIYWLSGNFFIERAKARRAAKTLHRTQNKIINENISVWIFPEGTRNKGNGLLPFKMGAFHLARAAAIPIVPICISSYYKNFKLNRLNNGIVYIEFMAPVTMHLEPKVNLRSIAAKLHDAMREKIQHIDQYGLD